jgi:hypothetical protein
MKPNKELTFAYGLAAALFVIGAVCYAAFPDGKPEQPVRIMLKNTGGKVLLDHKEHAASSGYAVPCLDCHHDMEDEKAKPQSCSECHMAEEDAAPKRSDAFHKLCKGCHEEGGLGPVKCSGCHML